MWRMADAACLYVVEDPSCAGNALVSLAVTDLDEAIAAIDSRGIPSRPLRPSLVQAARRHTLIPTATRSRSFRLSCGPLAPNRGSARRLSESGWWTRTHLEPAPTRRWAHVVAQCREVQTWGMRTRYLRAWFTDLVRACRCTQDVCVGWW